jgi:hypothetical protein
MSTRQTEHVRRHRARQRAQGLRPVQFWLPDTSTPEFQAAVAKAIAAVAELDPADAAMLEQFERWAAEDLADWPAPDIIMPETE